MTLKIKNAKVLAPDCSGFEEKDVYVKEGLFVEAMQDPENVLDADGLYLLPGMIDIHTHGANGVSFADKTDFSPARKWFAQNGVTAFLATVSTLPVDRLVEIEKNIATHPERKDGEAALVGIHLEGPFISEEKRGAMVLCDDECNVENLQKMINAGQGQVKLMTLAPERENIEAVIATGVNQGVRMSMGHTNATFERAKYAVDCGCTGVTHLYNAMRSFNHRETGVLGEAWTDGRVSCELICDFVHSSPIAVLTAYKLKGAENLIAISDTGNISGLPDGEYLELGRKVIVKDGQARNEEGNLTNSMLSVYEGSRNLLSFGVPLAEIGRITSLNPAKAIGICDRYGSIEVGKYADFLLCDGNMQLKEVFIGGKRVER